MFVYWCYTNNFFLHCQIICNILSAYLLVTTLTQFLTSDLHLVYPSPLLICEWPFMSILKNESKQRPVQVGRLISDKETYDLKATVLLTACKWTCDSISRIHFVTYLSPQVTKTTKISAHIVLWPSLEQSCYITVNLANKDRAVL